MNNHDTLESLLKEKATLEKLMAKDAKLGALDELLEQAENPKIMAVLLYKAIQEKERTNKLLETLNEKYDKIMFALKTNPQETSTQPTQQNEKYEVLSEQDQLILKISDERGGCTAKDIKTMLNYKGLNAACQRLNKLYREGHLKKVQSGRKVLYLAKS